MATKSSIVCLTFFHWNNSQTCLQCFTDKIYITQTFDHGTRSHTWILNDILSVFRAVCHTLCIQCSQCPKLARSALPKRWHQISVWTTLLFIQVTIWIWFIMLPVHQYGTTLQWKSFYQTWFIWQLLLQQEQQLVHNVHNDQEISQAVTDYPSTTVRTP